MAPEESYVEDLEEQEVAEVVPEFAPITPRAKREKPAQEPVRQRAADSELLKLSPEEKARLRLRMRIVVAVFSAVALLVAFVVLLMLSP